MWINVPSTTSPCAQAGADSTLAWSWLWDALAQSVGSNGKPSPASTWRRLWKRAAWLKRLCGRICEPSMAVLGVESWIASLRATRASRSVSPASVVDQTILGTCGLMSIESLARLNRHSYFSKTCPATSASDSTRLPQTLKAWATKLRQGSLLRRKSAQATSGNDCLSSPCAMPVDTSKGVSTSRGGERKNELLLAGQMRQCTDQHPTTRRCWRSPTAEEAGPRLATLQDKDGGPPRIGKRVYRKTPGREPVNQTVTLGLQVQLWQTIKASDGEKGGPNQRDGKGNPYLPMQAVAMSAELWPTPEVPNGGRTVPKEQMATGVTPTGRKVQKPLARTAELWPTPNVRDHHAQGLTHNTAARSSSLATMVAKDKELWPTPATRDHRTPNSQESQQRRNADSKRGQQLCNFASHDFSLPVPTNSTDGAKCSKSTMHLPRLNPLFVCWLMGWPRIAHGGFGFTATEWSRYRQRMRSALCGLCEASDGTTERLETHDTGL